MASFREDKLRHGMTFSCFLLQILDKSSIKNFVPFVST